MTEENETAARTGHEEKEGDPSTADEIFIFDYVMLDFADQFFAPRKNAQRGIVTEPGRSS